MIDKVVNSDEQMSFIAAAAMEDAINLHSPDLMSKLNANKNVMFLGKEYTTEEFNTLMFVWHNSVEIALDNYSDMQNAEICINPRNRSNSINLTSDFWNAADSSN